MWIIALCALVVVLPGCGRQLPEVKSAQRLLERRDYPGAEAAADRGLDQHPQDPALMRVKIQAVMGQLDAERAVALYQRWARERGAHDRAALRHMALTTLWQGLQVPSSRVRVLAIQAIERLEIESLARDVAARVEDDDDAVVAAAAVALLRSQPGAARAATQLLGSEDARARAIAVEGIGRKIGAAARADLADALGDGDPEVRARAASAFGAMGKDADTPRLAALVARDPDAAVRAAALRALRQRAHPEVLRVATAALGDAALEVRLAAVDVLAAGAPDTGARLAALLGTADDAVAVTAAAALGQGGNRTQALVERALASPSWEVRAAVLHTLPRLAVEPWARELAAAGLADAEERVRLAAATSLAALGDRRGLDALDALCASADADVREAAVRAQRGLPGAGPSAGLIGALADESAQVRVAAAEVLLSMLR